MNYFKRSLVLCFIVVFMFSGCITISNNDITNDPNTDAAYDETQPQKQVETEVQESKNKIEIDETQEKEFSLYSVGDTVSFGTFNYSGDNPNAEAPIDWTVLDTRNGNEFLLLADMALVTIPYNNEAGNTTWEESSVREWLNGEFYKYYFNDDEHNRIINTTLTTASDGNNVTEDMIFLLSADEVKIYLPTAADRIVGATGVADKMGGYDDNGNYGWWLRGAGDSANCACRVNVYGEILTFYSSSEGGVERGDYCVRPALWVRLG